MHYVCSKCKEIVLMENSWINENGMREHFHCVLEKILMGGNRKAKKSKKGKRGWVKTYIHTSK